VLPAAPPSSANDQPTRFRLARADTLFSLGPNAQRAWERMRYSLGDRKIIVDQW
jgi:hypothetical protein